MEHVTTGTFVIFGFVGAGEIAYIALWIIVPKEGGGAT